MVRKQPIQFLESKRKTDINVRTLSIEFVNLEVYPSGYKGGDLKSLSSDE